MSRLSRFLNQWRQRSLESEFDEELRFHLETRIEANLGRGMNRADAQAEARRHLGSTLRVREGMREARVSLRLDSVIRDCRHAVRVHRRNLPTTMAVIVTLALAIGAGTSVFSVVHALFLRPLPYPNADRVRLIWEDGTARGANARNNVSGANFLDWRDRTTAFDELAAVRNVTRTFSDLTPSPSPLFHAVTANFFALLGNQPLLGRTFARAEDAGQGAPVVILSYGIWQSLFAGDPRVIGRKIGLDGVPHEVIGVMPRTFFAVNSFATQPAAWIPLPIETFRHERGIWRFMVFGRLRDGVTDEGAQEQMARIAGDLAAEFPKTNERWSAAVLTIRDQLVGLAERPLALIVIATVALMLIAAFNVVCLLLAAGTARAKEMATRTALGASAGHVVPQLLLEAGLLAVIGAVLGTVLSAPITRYIVSLIPASTNIAFLDSVRVDLPVAVFAAACGLLIAVLCALVTARQTLKISSVSELGRQTDRSGTESRAERRMRDGLVVAQVALSVMLLLAAGLMVQTLRNLTAFQGFDADDLVTITASIRGPKYETAEARVRFFGEVASRIEAMPGVISASVASAVPPVSMFESAVFSVDDRGTSLESVPAALVIVQPGYFETMKIPAVAGRTTTRFDTPQSEPVVMISRELARRYFEGSNPLGRTLVVDTGVRKVRREIVGIIDDVRSQPPDPRPLPVVYVPHSQAPALDMAFVVRLERGRPMPFAAIRDIIRSVDPNVPAFAQSTMAKVVNDADWLARFVAQLLGVFTFVGLALVGAGLYGALAFVVAMRQREFGVRLALGARFAEIARIILGLAARVVALGVAVGILGFLVLGRMLESLLFGVTRTDSATLAGTIAVTTVVTFVVCLSPLRKALRVSPLIVMNAE